MESGKHKGQLGSIGDEVWVALFHHVVVANPSAYKMDERTEHAQNPQHTEDIEHHVRHGRPSGLRVGSEGSHIRGYCGSDVLTHHEGNTLINRQYAGGAEYHRDGHDGC